MGALHSAHFPRCRIHVTIGILRNQGMSLLQIGQNDRAGSVTESPSRGQR